jgi:hypothetical protein
VLVEPKTRAALPAALCDLLKSHRLAQLAERLRAGTVWGENGLVFCQPTGRPIDPRADWAS